MIVQLTAVVEASAHMTVGDGLGTVAVFGFFAVVAWLAFHD